MTTQQIRVPVLGDALAEGTQTFTVELYAPTNARIAQSEGTGTILDDDPAPQLSVDDVTIDESSGVAIARVPVLLSHESEAEVSVHVATVDGTAVAPSDYAGLDDGDLRGGADAGVRRSSDLGRRAGRAG